MVNDQDTQAHDARDRSINYIEFIISGMGKTKAFYGEVFGWRFTDYGPTYCEFSDGVMTGGFEVGEPTPHGGPLVVLYGYDLPALMTAITKAGGQITKPVFSFPGGERFHFTDLDGYELAVWRRTASAPEDHEA